MEEVKDNNTIGCGRHRGCNLPDLHALEEQVNAYDYEQYKLSMTHVSELFMMLSMDFPEELIHDLSSRQLASCDLDFIRIIYFILHDEEYLKTRILAKDSYVYEDILEDAIEEAVKRKYPEFTDVKLVYEKYKRLEKMADARIEFIDLQNEKLRNEIKSRQEEKRLQKEEISRETESLKAACADKDDTIGILMEQAKDLEAEKKALMHEKAEMEEEKEALSSELNEARERVSNLEMKIKNIRAAYEERENGNQASIKESLDAVMEGINRILMEIEQLGKSRNRRGIFGIFGDGSSESRVEEKPSLPGDDFVRAILTDPELKPDQYKLLIYCVEEGLPTEDVRAIADTKVDIERMEFLARWYFRKNKITYKYEGSKPDPVGNVPDGRKTMEFAAKEENA